MAAAKEMMNGGRRLALLIYVGMAIAMTAAGPCKAIDYQPFDYVPAAPGTNILMGYYEYGTRNEYNSTITGTVKHDTSLDSNIGILRYLYYNRVFDRPYLVEFLLPFGAYSNGKIGGARLNYASGVSDPIISASFWPISEPNKKRYFSLSSYLTLPVGTYDRTKSLNLGTNRWQHDLQADFTQGFLEKFTIDVAADWIYHGDNTEAGATGHQRLSQKDTYNVYSWLSYDVTPMMRLAMPRTSQASLSVGYAGTFGGVERLDGIVTGAKTREDQIRVTYSQFIAPTWQALISFNHDIHVSGQFNQDFGVVLRIAKVF